MPKHSKSRLQQVFDNMTPDEYSGTYSRSNYREQVVANITSDEDGRYSAKQLVNNSSNNEHESRANKLKVRASMSERNNKYISKKNKQCDEHKNIQDLNEAFEEMYPRRDKWYDDPSKNKRW